MPPQSPPEPPVTSNAPPPRGNPVVVATAKAMLGIPYRFGGDSPEEGFDCSGLVQYAYQQAGLYVPRTAREQFNDVIRLPPLAMDPGDLVFFRPPETGGLHVGIYLGGATFIHAPSTGKRIRFSSLDSPYWKACFLGGGRPDVDTASSGPPMAPAPHPIRAAPVSHSNVKSKRPPVASVAKTATCSGVKGNACKNSKSAILPFKPGKFLAWREQKPIKRAR